MQMRLIVRDGGESGGGGIGALEMGGCPGGVLGCYQDSQRREADM